MKTSNLILIVTALLLAALPFALATYAKIGAPKLELSGERVSEELEALPLKHLDIKGPIQLILTAGLPKVTLEGDSKLLQQLEREQDGDRLSLELPQFNGIRQEDFVIARVQTNDLSELRLEGRARAQSEAALPYRNFELHGAGGPWVELEFMDAKLVDVHYAGGGTANLRGVAATLDIDLSGGNTVDARELRAQHVSVDAAGGNTASVWADSTLDVSGAGSINVNYLGDPQVSSRGSGSVSVNRME